MSKGPDTIFPISCLRLQDFSTSSAILSERDGWKNSRPARHSIRHCRHLLHYAMYPERESVKMAVTRLSYRGRTRVRYVFTYFVTIRREILLLDTYDRLDAHPTANSHGEAHSRSRNVWIFPQVFGKRTGTFVLALRWCWRTLRTAIAPFPHSYS